MNCSSAELANTAGSVDSLLSDLGELLGVDDHWGVRELTLSEDLEETLQARVREIIIK